jgi:hypothetical protein
MRLPESANGCSGSMHGATTSRGTRFVSIVYNSCETAETPRRLTQCSQVRSRVFFDSPSSHAMLAVRPSFFSFPPTSLSTFFLFLTYILAYLSVVAGLSLSPLQGLARVLRTKIHHIFSHSHLITSI